MVALFANAEFPEHHIEQVLRPYGAGDAAERTGGQPQLFRQQLLAEIVPVGEPRVDMAECLQRRRAVPRCSIRDTTS